MKRIYHLFILGLLLVGCSVFAQTQKKIGSNATSIATSAAFEVESTSKGFLPPRMTQAQRNAIGSPVAGLFIYCTNCGSSGEIQFYNGSTWYGISSFYGGSVISQSGGNATCDGSRTTVVVELTSSTGKVWMDRNLGASQAATSSADYLAYGCLYQWGRGNDGHASISWTSSTAGTAVNGSTTTQATTDTPGNALFISTYSSPFDWRSPKNDSLWQGASSINNPCNSGYHVPTGSEFSAEMSAYSIRNAATAYSNGPGGGFKLVVAGNRYLGDGALNYTGSSGWYWSATTVSGTMYAGGYRFDSSADIVSGTRASGWSVRCLKD